MAQLSEYSVVSQLASMFQRPYLKDLGLEEALAALNSDPAIEFPMSLEEIGFIPESVPVIPSTVMPKHKSKLCEYLLEDEGRFYLAKDIQLPSKESLFLSMATYESAGELSNIVASLVSSMLMPKLLIGTDMRHGYSVLSVSLSSFKL